MKLETIYLSRVGYGPTPDQINGRLKVSTHSGEIDLKLKPEQVQAILCIVAVSLTDSVKEVAAIMTTELIEHAGQPKKLEG